MALEKCLRNPTEETENSEKNMCKKALKSLYTIIKICTFGRGVFLCANGDFCHLIWREIWLFWGLFPK